MFDPRDVVQEALAKPDRQRAIEEAEKQRKVRGVRERAKNIRRGARRTIESKRRPAKKS
jgi:hypothetical protein